MVEIVAILNLTFLIEYPEKKGIVIKERGNVFNPDQNTSDIIDEHLEVEDNENIPNIKFSEALCIFGVFQFAVSFFFIKYAFYGVYYWLPTYL